MQIRKYVSYGILTFSCVAILGWSLEAPEKTTDPTSQKTTCLEQEEFVETEHEISINGTVI